MSFQPPHADEKELVDALKQAGFFTTNVQKALSYAKRAHQNQKRDFGTPYLEEHIYPIALNILNHNGNHLALEDVLVLGILHDVVEDNPHVSLMDIEKDFGRNMATAVSLLTKKPEENLAEISEAQKTHLNAKILKSLEYAPQPAQIVKLEDRLNNLSSFEKANTPKYVRYVKETEDLFIPFAQKTIPLYKNLLIEQLNRLSSV